MGKKISDFKKLRLDVEKCTKCPLSKTRTNAVPGSGSVKSTVFLIGEAPGKDEDLQGIPFVGRSGKILDQALSANKISRDEVYITNLVKCRPPDNRKPSTYEVEQCNEHLETELRLIKPSLVALLGATSLKHILNKDKITQIRGRLIGGSNYYYLPTFHPAAIARNNNNRKFFYSDIKKIKRFLKR